MSALTIQLPGLPPVTHVLKDDTITIGRMKGNSIVIDDTSVSLCHAKITRLNGDFYLKDLNSTNGTLVNGQTISEAPLRNLDRVRLGEVLVQFTGEGANESVSTPALPYAIKASTPPAVKPATVLPAPVASGSKRKISALVPLMAGGAMVLFLAAFAGWKFSRAGQAAANAAPPPALAAVKISAASAPPVAAAPGIAEWMTALKADDPMRREDAARALHALGRDAKDALPALREALTDMDPEVRLWSALTLVDNEANDTKVVPILVDALYREDDPLLRQVSCLSLALVPCNDAEKNVVVPALAEAAGKDANEEVRQAAVSALKVLAPELVNREAGK